MFIKFQGSKQPGREVYNAPEFSLKPGEATECTPAKGKQLLRDFPGEFVELSEKEFAEGDEETAKPAKTKTK